MIDTENRVQGNWVSANDFVGGEKINLQQNPARVARSFRLNGRPIQTSGEPAIYRLPIELLGSIIILLQRDIRPNGIRKRNADLMALLLTSRQLYNITLVTLYQNITIPHSMIFRKFLFQIAQYPSLGKLVRRFNFCHFNPIILFENENERLQTHNLTSISLLRALQLTPNLREFLAQEHIDDELDFQVLRKLFFGFERIRALDFCGCSSPSFQQSFISAMAAADRAKIQGLKRLSLHSCITLPPIVFELLLPNLPQLTHLDVARTHITDTAILSLAKSAQITHLNLAKCNKLSSEVITRFIATHTAVKKSLVWLSVTYDSQIHKHSGLDTLTELLRRLPRSLKSFSLRGSSMNRSHIALLLPLTEHLEELALGRGLALGDLHDLFHHYGIPQQSGASNCRSSAELERWVHHSLRYLDLSDVWCGRLNLSELYDMLRRVLFTAHTAPLDVVEIPKDAACRLLRSNATTTGLGWRVSDIGDRTWAVRDCCASRVEVLAGSGDLRVGSQTLGSRKVSVAQAEAGSIYASYI